MNRTAARNKNDRVTNEEIGRMADNTDFGPKKTLVILAIVAGCFAVLWPKIFYPMISGPVHTIPTPLDAPACCDLVFTNDVNAVDIMQEMCRNILRHHQVDPRVRDALNSGKLTPQSANFCREEVLARCGIDLSSFLAEKERLGKTYKQVLEEIRTFNSSICLKRHFGVPLSQLGTPHLIRYHILMPHSPIRQERRTPPHAGGLHPAMRERGRAIPSSHIVPKVDGRPDHVVVQKLRPPLGAAGRVVPAPTGSTGMGIIMPLYSLGIVLFFLYTIAKVMRKNSDNEIYADYQNPAAEREFRNRVFNPEILASAITGQSYYRKDCPPSPIRPTPTIEELKEQAAGDIEIDQLRQRLVDTEAAMERIVVQMGSLSRTVVHSPSPPRDTQLQDDCRSCCSRIHNGLDDHDESSSTVKVMGMEMTACCEGGQRISRPTTPIIPQAHSHPEREMTPPKPIYLEGALPPQCELLVTDSEMHAENSEDDTEAPVVLSGKMTLSLISHDQNQAESEDERLDDEEDDGSIEGINVIFEDTGKSSERSDSAEMIGNSEEDSESEEVEDEEGDEGEDEDENDSEEEVETELSEQSGEVEEINIRSDKNAVQQTKQVEQNVSAINTDNTDEESDEDDDENIEDGVDADEDSNDEESVEESEEEEAVSESSEASEDEDPIMKSATVGNGTNASKKSNSK